MMTLEEAIKHCKDIALSCTNKKCALEHFQLLKWLQEYSNILEKQREQKPAEKYNITGIGSKNAQGKLGEMIKNLKPVNEVLEQKPADRVEPEPIFKVGDIVRYKGHACDGVITEITNTDYICGNAKLPISTQDKLELVEQKSAWSEEDEKKNEDEAIRSNPIPELPSSAFRLGFKLGWFKVLKERVQSNQEWKQENTDDLTEFENALMHIGDSFFGQHAGLNPNDTNAIKEQANILLGLVPKEWSEEEENNFKKAIKVLRVNNFHNTADMLQEMKYKLIPREETNNWKPSDEQMGALKDACDKHWEPDGLDPLYTLWKQLKKLKE